MKIILLLITVLFSSMAVTSCTNDEGDNDLDYLAPNDEEEFVLKETQIEDNSN
ncbi:MAG: hypothetical protein RIM83_10645 [Allomuricauda sp.]|jgi:hypothetical protein|uniref:hypothetical protein n=1 Tax=Allomuricauda sp. CP2A TaxID=1848189 RepID=UPI00159EE26E|nr:hypothetical protein [Muricauda sp. CP2A]